MAHARQAWIEFRSRPWMSGAAVLTLALGIAGATTMFAALTAIASMTVPPGLDAARVGRVVWTSPAESGARTPLMPAEYKQVKAAGIFGVISASTDDRMVLGGPGGPAVAVKRVSADFFRTFEFAPIAGRTFDAGEASHHTHVAVVRDGFRARRGGLDPGHVVRLGDDEYTIVGVLSDRCWFLVPDGTDLWIPLDETDPAGASGARPVTVTARLGSLDARERVQAQVATIGTRLTHASVSAPDSRRLRFVSLQEDAEKRLGTGALALLGPAIVVLLIACGNVANLLLARGARREREMAVRAALGATRLRLIRERLVESAWLAAAGGVFGLALALAGVRLLRAWLSAFEPARSAADRVRLDSPAVLFAFGVTLAIPLVFGLVPALVASRPDLARALHQAPGGRRARRGPYGLRELLVITEIGLAVVLVVGALMISRFFTEVGRVDWGFDASNVLAVQVSLDGGAARRAADARLLSQIVNEVRLAPGVRSAAAGGIAGLRLQGEREPIEFEGCAATDGAGAVAVRVGPQYFSTLGLPVRQGRAIVDTDDAGSPPVAVISEKHARRCWPGLDPLGRRVRVGRGTAAAWLRVVGVTRDTMTTRALPDALQPIYVPYAQAGGLPRLLLVRTAGSPLAHVDAVRAAVRRADSAQMLEYVERLDQGLRRDARGMSLITGVLGGFGAFALALGALGVFSVMSYTVSERSREFGIRIALGASRGQVLRLVLQRALVLVSIGSVVSLAGTLAVTRAGFREMATFALTDTILWVSVCALLTAVALGASLVPARRAVRVEPVVALRAE